MSSIEPLTTGLVFGLANAAHCAGMCGVFALGAARARGMPLYLVGKTFTYVFLGAIAGWIGAGFLRVSQDAQLVLGLAVGLVLVVAGWRLLAGSNGRGLPGLGRALEPLLAGVRGGRLPGGGFTLGAVTGALPCGAVYLAALQGVALGSPAGAATLMAGFAVGTMPVLLGIGLVGPRLPSRLGRTRLQRLGGGLILCIGLVTLLRSLLPLLNGACH